MIRLARSIAIIVAVVFATAACGAAARPTGSGPTAKRRVLVRPGRGRPVTTFVVTFTAPEPTGTSGRAVRRYRVSAAPVHDRRGCIGSVSVAATASRAGEAVAVRLDPRRLGGRWCTEAYRGEVVETQSAVCSPTRICPQYVVLVARIGRFGFSVRR